MNKFLKYTTIILLSFINNLYALDTEELKTYTDAITEAQESYSKLSDAKSEEAKILDEAINKINEATSYIEKSLDINNNKEAIKALDYVEKSLTDIENFIPPEFSSDMSQIDISVFTKDEMNLITEITSEMKSNKNEKLADLVKNMTDLNENGLSTFDISKSLNELGIETVNLSIELDKKKEMENWSKEQWADSYKGSILTSTGEQVITDKEITAKVTELESKLTLNNQKIFEKTTSLNALKSKIDPLNSEIAALNLQKDNLTIQYNQELLKQTNILEATDITESKKLTDNLNKEIENLSNSLNQKSESLLNLNSQVKELNLELDVNITLSSNLASEINGLNSNLLGNKSLISKKEIQLEQLNNTKSSFDKEINSLNNEIKSASVERDFIETEFERSIDKEVEAFRYYATALSDYEIGTPEYIRDAKFSLKEVSVITDNDPRAQRIFDLQKYGLEAGLSKEYIDRGIQSIKNDDWDAQKNIYKDIIDGMSKNPNWTVNKLTDAEINVAILEDKAIQEAVQIVNEGAATRIQVDQIINEKTQSFQGLASLNDLFIRSASIQPYMNEYEYFNVELEKTLATKLNEIQLKESEIQKIQNEINDFQNNREQLYKEYQNQISQAKLDFQKLENEIIQHNALSKWGNKAWVDKGQALYQQRVDTFYDRFASFEDPTYNNINKINSISNEIAAIKNDASQEARQNLLNLVQEAKTNVETITKEEISKAPNYNYKDKIDAIINDVSTWGDEEKNRVSEALLGNSFGVTNENRGAAVRAALLGKEDFNAFTEVAKELAQIDEKNPFAGNPYFEKSNIRAAAILRSKKYDYVDNYQYVNAVYNPVELNTEQRSEVESALKDILVDDNPKLNALNQKITNLNNQIELINQELTSVPSDISKIENELNNLKSNEKELENQLKDLQKEFDSNKNSIVKKSDELNDLKNKLSPITNEITLLQNQKNELNAKLNEQISILNNKIVSSDKAKVDALNLKTQFENQLANLNTQVEQYEKESVVISSQLSVLNNELEELKISTPEIKNKIDNLNNDLVNFIDLKADLALAEAKKNDINFTEKVIDQVKTMENKSIITIQGTDSFRVVDNKALMDNKGNFNIPKGTLTIKGNVYTAGAVQPEMLFSFSKLNTENEINLKLSNVEKDYELGKITEEQFKNEINSINALRNNATVEFSQLAAKELSLTGTLKGGEQKFTGSTLGSWVLVNATTGEQMKNPLTGHSGGVVGTADVLGPNGDFGKQAASFGGMYVLESLANKNGNVASRCVGGGCKFDVETLRVLGPNNIENNLFNERGEGLFQAAFTSAELNEIEKDGMTTLQRQHAIEYAVKNNISFDASKLVSEESLKTQASALAYAAKNNIGVSEINKVAGSYSKFKTDNFKEAVKSTVTYSGEAFSLNNASASTASDAASSATSAVSSAATDVSQTVSEATSAAAQQAATAAVAAAQEVSQEVAQAAQEAAAEATAVASSVITGNDLEALSQLANDALGAWVLVDAATGKQMTNPLTGYSGSSVCTASHCGAAGAAGKAAAEFGGVYVLERLADPETGNVAGSCASGDCQFDLGNGGQ